MSQSETQTQTQTLIASDDELSSSVSSTARSSPVLKKTSDFLRQSLEARALSASPSETEPETFKLDVLLGLCYFIKTLHNLDDVPPLDASKVMLYQARNNNNAHRQCVQDILEQKEENVVPVLWAFAQREQKHLDSLETRPETSGETARAVEALMAEGAAQAGVRLRSEPLSSSLPETTDKPTKETKPKRKSRSTTTTTTTSTTVAKKARASKRTKLDERTLARNLAMNNLSKGLLGLMDHQPNFAVSFNARMNPTNEFIA